MLTSAQAARIFSTRLSTGSATLPRGSRAVSPRARDGSRRAFASGGFRDRFRDLRRNGTPEIALGLTLLGLLVADRFLWSRHKSGRDRVFEIMEREIRADGERGREEAEAEAADAAGRPALFRCAVRRAPDMFDGTRCLTGVEVGDVVDVIEEGVGPGNAYNLCRVSGEGEKVYSVGWFPMMWLEKPPN